MKNMLVLMEVILENKMKKSKKKCFFLSGKKFLAHPRISQAMS